MARARRTQFAAPLVMVVASACGSSKAPDPKPEPEARPTPKDDRPRWTLSRQGDRCTAMPHVECPPPDVATCNPPPPMTIACGDLPEGSTEVVQLKPGRCVVTGGNRLVTCPVELPPPPPSTIDAGVAVTAVDAAAVAAAPVTWHVGRSAKGCAATEDVCGAANFPPGQPVPPCNPPAPIKIDCPPDDVVAILQVSPGHCVAQIKLACPPNTPCNPPPPSEIACPTR